MRRLSVVLAMTLALAGLPTCGADIDPDAIRVACVGDSITYGMNIRDREDNCYPTVLGQLLGDKYVVGNFGVIGATLLKKGNKPYWNQSALEEADDFQPHIVIIELGTNDTKPHNWKFKDDFEDDLRALMAHFSSLKSKPRIFLCNPVPVVRDRGGINEETLKEEVIRTIEAVAKEGGVPLIDLHAALRNRPVLFPDGVHPNGVGARIIAKTVYDALAGSSSGK